jgi:hypothetical protein
VTLTASPAAPRAARFSPGGSASEAFEAALCALIAGVAAALVVYAVPRGGDLAAHLYRTSLVRHGILVWDNLWFAGQYPLSSYSLLYYPLAALTGNAPLGVAGVVLAAAAFAAVARRQWLAVGAWPARAFAVLIAGQAFTAAYPYDLGVAALLGAIAALQRRRTAIAIVCTVLTLGFSPLAFVFLALALFAVLLARRRIDRQTVAVTAAAALAGSVQLALLILLPSPGLVYPYGAWRLLAGLALAAAGALLSLRGRAGLPLASLFGVWAAASVAVYLVRSPIGHNLVRASVFVFPLMLVAAALADFRPRWLVTVATVGALAANVLPYAPMISARASTPDAHGGFWRATVDFLERHGSARYRVEVVPTANHWESYYVPAAGIALARGWYRQLDIADNPQLYARRLTPRLYRSWLRARAVRFVVVPDLRLEAIDAQREAALVRSPATGLERVWSSRDAVIYELPHPTPLLSGPGRARVTELDSRQLRGRLTRPGTYLLRIHFSPYWTVAQGSICLARAAGRMTRLVARRSGRFVIRAVESPAEVLDMALGGDRHRCRS